MSEIVRPGQGILFMKVGVHANESLEDIIERKTQEIEDAGFALWGYGGNTCHPTSMVQPFAGEFEAQDKKIMLCMQQMQSRHFAEPIRAEYFSVDGNQWDRIPGPINVLGSRFALAIKGLHREEFSLPLSSTCVSYGRSKGRPGNRYISGRVDKACLEVMEGTVHSPDQDNPDIQISLVAELCRPYAVFLKN